MANRIFAGPAGSYPSKAAPLLVKTPKKTSLNL